MPQNLPITLFPPVFPNGYCPPNWQQLANDIADGMTAQVPGGYSLFNYGNTEPAPADRLKPWFRLFPDGSPDKWYVFFSGGWVATHPVPSSNSELRLWSGAETALVTYDGGDASPATDRTGPMWQVDHSFDALFCLAPGTLPSGKVVNVGDKGGEEQHTLVIGELPVQHLYPNPFAGTAFPAAGGQIAGGGADENQIRPFPTQTDVGGGLPHNNLPPYVGTFLIKRTARLFYTPA